MNILYFNLLNVQFADGKVNVPNAGYNFLSWEKRDFKFSTDVRKKLEEAYESGKYVCMYLCLTL